MSTISSRGYANADVLVSTEWVAEHLNDNSTDENHKAKAQEAVAHDRSEIGRTNPHFGPGWTCRTSISVSSACGDKCHKAGKKQRSSVDLVFH